MRTVPMVALLLALFLPQPGYSQSRPAPDTPGDGTVLEEAPPPSGSQLIDALRVLAVTSGIIGGFVAADLISGGVLTAPLLTGADAAAGAVRAVPRALGLRPAIAAAPEPPGAAELPELRRALGRALAPPAAGTPGPAPALPPQPRR